MDLFDNGKKPKSAETVALASVLQGQSLDAVFKKLDYDLQIQVVSSAFFMEPTKLFSTVTVCLMVAAIRDLKKSKYKYSPSEVEMLERSYAGLLKMVHDPQEKSN